MSDKTGIEWTEATWNPVTGCSKVSQGCKNCYAERDWQRLSAPRAKPTIYTGRAFTDVRCHQERLDQPLRWRKPRRIFVNSMSDLFHNDVPDRFIADVFAVMETARDHTFQILTKRPARMQAAVAIMDKNIRAVGYPQGFVGRYPHVWLGVSVEDQATADERIPLLLQTPAAVRWISAEPLLGPIDFHLDGGWCAHCKKLTDGFIEGHCMDQNSPCFSAEIFMQDAINWIVAGGESGPKARPSHPAWFRSLRDQCAYSGVPYFFKQWGEFHPSAEHDHLRTGCKNTPEAVNIFGDREYRPSEQFRLIGSGGDPIWAGMCRIGKHAAGRLLDGVEHNGYPK